MSRDGKQRRSAESRRRAWTYLQQLDWLAGFPDDSVDSAEAAGAGFGWRTLRGERLVVDGARVARSRRAARTAMREHPEALAGLVGDVARWWAIVDAALSWCSAPTAELELLGHQAPRLSRTAHELLRAQPASRAAVFAASVAWAHDPAELGRVLSWLAAHPEVAELSTAHALAVAQLARHGGGGALLALFALDAPEPHQAIAAVEQLSGKLSEVERTSRQRKGKPRSRAELRAERAAQIVHRDRRRNRGVPVEEAAPPQRSRARVEAWLDALLPREEAEQRRAMQLLEVVDLAGAMAPWQAWEAASAPRLGRAAELAERELDLRQEWEPFERVRASVAAILKEAPPKLSLEDALDEVRLLAISPKQARCFSPILRLLAAQPAEPGPAWRANLLAHLGQRVVHAEHDRLPWLWSELADALEAGAPPGLMAPWHSSLSHYWRTWLDEELVEQPVDRAQVRRIVAVLVELARRGSMSADDAAAAALWVGAGLVDAALTADTIERTRNGRYQRALTRELATGLVAIYGAAPAALGEAVRILEAATEDASNLEKEQLAALMSRATRAGFGWLVREALAAEQASRLIEIAASLAVLPRGHWPRLRGESETGSGTESETGTETGTGTGTGTESWISRYPAALHAALARLVSVDEGAEATAAKKLAQDLPEPEALRREIAALRSRAPLPPRMQTRLANLEERLATPPQPTPQRLTTLAKKLEATAGAVGLERLAAASFSDATARLLRTFRLSGWPDDWPRDRKTLQALHALHSLDPIDRQLAGRILQARLGPPPWDLRDEPANRAFLDKLRARGLVMEPWLDAPPQHIMVRDEPVELELCADPLQIFQMGAYFQTCLSPGSCNFFSVVANAADINKRVLYARRAGRVVARCLLALTDGGGVLAFNPYCFDNFDFAGAVARYAGELAARMGTELAPRGHVSTLLSRDWYDDGARDLVGRFKVLHDDKQLDLAAIAPAALPAKLRELLGRPLDDVTLPLILALPGVRNRAELVVPLTPALLGCTSPATRVEAALMASQLGDRDLADRLLGDHAATVALDDHSWFEAELVAELRPSFLLTRLRATRPRGVRSWHAESGLRLTLAGVALEALRRPAQAAAMYRRALAVGVHLGTVIAHRLQALEAAG